jgi:UMF1 family MFS transporter
MIKDKKILSWALYDWANSVYSTTVMAGFFPLFFQKYWSSGADSALTTARLGSAISISSFAIAVFSPVLGSLADIRGWKKELCFGFMLIGAACCAWMAFIDIGQWWPAILAYSISMFAFGLSAGFNDAQLPHVAQGRDMDRASSLGYSLGYLGGGILFTINVLMFLFPAKFGLASPEQGVKYSFLTVGVWWLVFSLPMMKYVPEEKIPSTGGLWQMVGKSLKNLNVTFVALLKEKNTLLFILAYWLYIDGVYTVMTMAVDYGVSLGLESKDLIVALLLTQYIGFPCAYFFGTLTTRWGSRKPILVCIGIYALTVVLATQMTTAAHFYALACIIGMVQGGVQALSRSLFGNMIPAAASGEYFGLFNLIGKFASILGPLIVAVTVYYTHQHRFGMLGLLVLFAVGGALLWKVKEHDAV